MATRASSSSARAARTRPRWSSSSSSELATYRLRIAYDGTPFAGWAAQPGLRTVQGEVEAGLERVLGEPVALAVAGRTDAGVHAWEQVASFELAAEAPPRLGPALDAVTAPEISVRAAEPVEGGFDARRDARSRTYCYRVLAASRQSPFERGRAMWWRHPLDRETVAEAAAATRGTHDFTAFTPTQTDHVRFRRDVLRCEWRQAEALGLAADETLLELWIEADAFVRHMVRILVGTMLEVGSGRRSLEDFRALLEGAARSRAGETAPPFGLYLAGIRY